MSRSPQKRLRVFAGPNGSGKTTIIDAIRKQVKIPLGIYVNADDIEKRLREKSYVLLSDYELTVSNSDLTDFFRSSTLRPRVKGKISMFPFQIRFGKIFFRAKKVNSYDASFIASFLRYSLVKSGRSFSFETVMSHESKLQELTEARKKGYRVYLYYVATKTPEININRVENRVEKGGHNVDSEKVKERYKRALNLLFDAVLLTHRAYVFDNSGRNYELIAEITDGKEVDLKGKNRVPSWFYDNFYLKSIKKNK